MNHHRGARQLVNSSISTIFQRVAKPRVLALREYLSILIDRSLGVATTDEAVASALGIDIDVFRRTQRSLGWSGVLRMLRHLQLSPSDVLLDIGCGAGRVICGAARTPVAKVRAIDIDPRMVELAAANVASLRGRRCEVVVECADATTFDVPDESTVFVLYNPFGGDVLRAAMARIVESIDRAPRPVRVVYANPKEPEIILAAGRFAEAFQFSLGWRPGTDWKRFLVVQVYSNDPS